jgi:Nif-specific regulatory protein
MNQFSETKPRLQKILGDAVSQVSSGFMTLIDRLTTDGTAAELHSHIDKLFKSFVNSHRTITAELSHLLHHLESLEQRLEHVNEERRRLEVLYTSGISFSTETEMKALVEKAIDTVVKELKADAGFIVLVNEEGEPSSVYSRNMNPDAEPTAKDMSMSVIRSTISSVRKAQRLDAVTDVELTKHQSVLRLGITAVLCVPLVSGTKVLGAVYLDRRNKEHPFTEADLAFLMSFARQIVRGLEISLEITTLENKLISDAGMKFEDLRKEFQCSEIIGSSKKLFDVMRIASKIALTDASAIILGENGTGKDLLAKAIHANSHRSSKPFVTINCGAIPTDLLESELFGFESGAFTGAMKSKQGRLELADGGTVFFDEIGELNVNLQAKLLRVLQTKEIERLGSVTQKRIDIRFLSATNKNLSDMIERGLFREDLYYRLKVVELTMPPLRERKEDIASLVGFFLRKHSGGIEKYLVSDDALDILERYHWPGNIRELENVIHRCIVLAKETTIQFTDLPPELIEQSSSEPSVAAGKQLLDAETEFRRMYIIKALRQYGSVTEAAKQLGVNRTHFYKLLSQLEIEY